MFALKDLVIIIHMWQCPAGACNAGLTDTVIYEHLPIRGKIEAMFESTVSLCWLAKMARPGFSVDLKSKGS